MEDVKVREVFYPEEKDKEENHKEIERVCKELGLVEKDYKFEYEEKCSWKYAYKQDRIILPEKVCQEIKKVVKSGINDFSWTKFSGDTIFKEAEFKGNAEFIRARFSRRTCFHEVTFYNKADFSKAIFFEYSSFFKAVFKEDAIFHRAIFNKEADFSQVTFEIKADFSKVKFEEYLYFDIEKVQNLILDDISNRLGNGFLRIMGISIDEKIKEATRHTWQLFKHVAQESHNKILANKLLQKEMVAYWKETTWSKNFGEKFILLFNFISNNCGLWWWLGIIFTIATTMFLYFLSQTFTSDFIFIGEKDFTLNEWTKFLGQYIKSFFSIEAFTNDETVFGEKFFLLLEKIFLVIGIFRINQAFRKLNDKG
ncbi:MAG: pentapeptide repeat-containing protein [Fusobacteriaceae bacterium]